MNIKTKFDMGTIVKFHPFYDSTLDKIEGVVIGIDINVYRNNISITYQVKTDHKKYPVWLIEEDGLT